MVLVFTYCCKSGACHKRGIYTLSNDYSGVLGPRQSLSGKWSMDKKGQVLWGVGGREYVLSQGKNTRAISSCLYVRHEENIVFELSV